ncbi:MAG: hypothetical protein OES47_06955 [Acidobacteriota bacterium]|nr:hypothetical protein [Acidobacteriota bacterium]
MKRFLSSGLVWVVFATIVGVASSGAPLAAGEETKVEPAKAKALFVDTHKCNMCHGVPAAEIEAKTKSEKMKGPELGGKIEVEFAKIAAYLRKEADLDGESHSKGFKGTDEELQAIIDWLGSLEAQE